MKKFTFLIAFFALTTISHVFAQKVVVLGINHLTPDGFSFVVTENLPIGEVIYFTENEYNNAGNAFLDQTECVVKFTVTLAINTGNVVFVKETGVSTDLFTVTSSGGSGTAVKTAGSGSFSISTNGEGFYAYTDNDENPVNGITEIYSVLYTGSGESPTQNGGLIPGNENPVTDYPNAIVVDGFPNDGDVNVGLNRVEYNPALRNVDVSIVDFTITGDWLYGDPNADLSITPFVGVADPGVSVTVSPSSVLEDGAANLVYTFTLGETATSNVTVNFSVGGTAVFSSDYTQTGAATFGASSGTVVIANGTSSASVTINPSTDTDLETNETVLLTVNPGTGYIIGSPINATGTITNDDVNNTAPLVAITGVNQDVPEGLSFVALDNITSGTVVYFTENSFDNSTLTFTGSEAVLKWTAPGAGLAKGEVVVIKEDPANTFTLTCVSGVCGTVSLESGTFDLATTGESVYAYNDADNNPLNGVTDIYSVLFTGTSVLSGGNIPTNEDPSSVYTGSVVVDGFANSAPNRTEYDPLKRVVDVSSANFSNLNNWLHAQSNQDLSTVPFVASIDPSVTVSILPSNVLEDGATNMVYTFTLSELAASEYTINFDVGGTATLTTDYTQTGAVTFGASSGTVVIPNGSSSATVTIVPVPDSDLETDETIILTVSPGTGYVSGSPSSQTGTINNDDTNNIYPKVAITGLNHLDSDGFSFVAAYDIPANTKIYFTEKSFNNTTLKFGSGESVLSWTSPASIIPAGDVIVVTETATNVFSLTRSSGSGDVGSITVESGDFATGSNGETFYAYNDDDNDPTNGVTDIYAVLYTGNVSSSGGTIPATENPSGVYLNALIVDGFAATQPNRTEYDPTKRNVLVEIVDFENVSNWIYAGANQVLSEIPFTNLQISDNIPPVAVCKNITVSLDGTGNVSIVAEDLDGSSTDNSGMVFFSADITNFDCSMVGPNNVLLTVTDAAGNSDNCTAVVTVEDNIVPVITCPANITAANDPGVCGAIVNYIPPVGTDNCPEAITTQTAGLGSGAFFPVGVTTETYMVTDAAGNLSLCSFTVTVNDTEAPVINCPGTQFVDLNENCMYIIPNYLDEITITDNCEIDLFTQSLEPGSIISANNPSASSGVTITVTDKSGNTSTCSFALFAVDNTPPNFTTCPSNIEVENDAGQCGAIVNWDEPTALDNCGGSGIITQTAGLANGSEFPVGVTTVEYTVVDGPGNQSSCSFTITVKDTEGPKVDCKDFSADLDENREWAISIGYILANAFNSRTDNCDLNMNLINVTGPLVYTCDNLGTNTITLYSLDVYGNQTSCTVTLTINDPLSACNQPPVASCQNLWAHADANCENNLIPASAFDNNSFDPDGDPLTFSVSPAGPYPVGETQVTFTVSDGLLEDQCTAIITILDVTPPIAPVAPADLFLQCASDVPPPVSLTAVDKCNGNITVIPTAQITPGNCLNDFVMVRIWTFTDAANNSVSVSQTIVVKDDVEPATPAPPADLNLQCVGDVPTPVDLTALDNCEGPITVSPTIQVTPGACDNEFVEVRTWTFTDGCGNTSSVSQTITVKDDVAPVLQSALPADLNVQCAGEVSAPVDLTALDNCEGPITVSPTIQVTPGTCDNEFVEVRTWTFTDDCGNTSSVSQKITVKDETPPMITGCPIADVQIPFTDAGECYYTATGTEFDVSASDNCGGIVSLAYVLSGATTGSGSETLAGVQFNYGKTTVVWTATDICGNSSTCSFIADVEKIETITSVSVNPVSQQYSDQVEFEASVEPWDCLASGQTGDVTFYVGSQAMGLPVAIGSDGKATATYSLAEIPTYPSNNQMSPGVKTVTAEFNNTDPAYSILDPTTELTITQEDAIVEYVGTEFQATPGSNSEEAMVELRVILKSVSDGTGLGGDIRNACVSIEIDNTVVASGLTPELIDPSDLTTGVITLTRNFDIGSADYKSFDVKVIADCYFVGEDQTVVTVYKPVGDFITGGGHIKPTLSAGKYASTPGLKTNFGFHVKFNKKGKNLIGGMNIIFRQQVGDDIQLFQIKTNSMTSLGINIANPDEQVGEFVSKANLRNLTTGEGLGGNLTLQVKLTDRGEPGAEDEIAITLWDRNVLLYSSEWTGTNTAEQLLAGGNLVVHAGFSLKAGEIVTGISGESYNFEVNMYPNPSKGDVTLEITASEIKDSEVIVRSITGSEVFRKEYKAAGKIKIDLSEKVSGIYLITLKTGSQSVVKKLILDRK